MTGFEPLGKPRFRIESEAGKERVVIPASKSWFVLPFLMVWLAFWTMGGMAAIAEVLSGSDGASFLLIWLVAWAFGWIFAASWIAWQLSGREFLTVEGGALVKGWSVLGFGRSKRYDLSHVTGIGGSAAPFPYGMMRVSTPPFLPAFFGSVKWNYGATTVYAASGPSEAEGEMVAERLRARLPASLRG